MANVKRERSHNKLLALQLGLSRNLVAVKYPSLYGKAGVLSLSKLRIWPSVRQTKSRLLVINRAYFNRDVMGFCFTMFTMICRANTYLHYEKHFEHRATALQPYWLS
jgi:hypothetical protein